ncbi:MAG: hypothetical protein GWP06_08565 [Actinobacteria bacterium]|nr:hypothetical protein [Actinomycetota bacterium]
MNKHGHKLLLLIIGNALLFQMFVTGVISANAKADNKLAVVITAQGNTIHVKGYCVYVRNGQDVRKKLEKDDAWGWNFHGEYIKKVHIRKISGDASYRLYVIENDEYLFESDSTSSSKPIIYKR